ncbi:MAG: hypothetical protein AAFN40_06250 [Cyanobacteria bacterium J06560_6]
MALNTSEKDAQRPPLDVDNEFYVRAIAAWILLLVPGFLVALVSGHWLRYFAIAPIIVSPLTVWTYDLIQFLKKPGKRSIKLSILALVGFALALSLSALAKQIYIEPAVSSIISSDIETSTPISESIDSKILEPQRSQPAEALERARELGKEASEMVQAPPHPLTVWEMAQQKWAQAIQHLESVPSEAEVYEEARLKLTSYQANQSAIIQRIETEKKAANSYEIGRRLSGELAALIQPISYPAKEDLPMLEQASAKLEMATKSFHDIPSGTAISELAKESADRYSEDYQILQSVIQTLESCELDAAFDCGIDEYTWMTLVSDSEKNARSDSLSEKD